MTSEKTMRAILETLKKHRDSFVTPALTEIGNLTKDPFQVLISCILSLRTKDVVTATASKRLYAVAHTPQAIAALSVRALEKLIYPVGFYKRKAKQIKAIACVIHTQYHNRVPNTMDELLTFNGVGRKTANIVLVHGFHKEGLPIDTHCFRIPQRWGWITAKTPEEAEAKLRSSLPKRYWGDFNNLVVQFGQNICTPVSPYCSRCPVERYCHKVGVTRQR